MSEQNSLLEVLSAMDGSVIVDKYEYVKLNNDSKLLELLVSTLPKAAELSYDGKHLRFDDTMMDALFALCCPHTYDRTLKYLQDRKAADDLMNMGGEE